jgi:hypothetical protein
MRVLTCSSWRPIWRGVAAQRKPRSGVFGTAFVFAVVLVALALPAPAHGADLPVPQRSPEEVKRTVRDVLQRPEYRRDSPTIIERARRWVRDQLSRLLTSLFRGDRGTVLAWAILGGLSVLVLVLSLRFARGVTPDPSRSITASVSVRWTAADWRADAETHERAGEWRLALRARYRALVAELAARGVVDEIPGRTAGEYRVEVTETAPRVGPEFAGATELFERAWYGNRPTGADEAARFRALEQRVLTGARQ